MRKVAILTLCCTILNVALAVINKNFSGVLGWLTATLYIFLYLSETKNNKEVIIRDLRTGRFKKK